jgi:dTDP-4-amino-4,6-dideoxygalactose transaminase/UDP-N-acetylmuramyl pentapeptide phosphotransferase/UDP-N-acetylglucosamine-1-phosphate transferase
MPFVVALVASAVLSPIAGAMATAVGLVDRPSGDLKIHARPIPVLGGGAVVAACTATLALAEVDVAWMVAVGVLIAFAGGLLDDARPLPAGVRVLILVGAGAVVALGPLLAGASAAAVAGVVFLVVACSNAVNIVDGQDGLAGGLAGIAALGLTGLAAGAGDEVGVAIGLATAGSVMGFLVWNWPRARIFLGNGGAYAIGAILASLAVRVTALEGWAGLVASGACLGVFAFEVLFTAFRRALSGGSITAGDRSHSYDLLAQSIGRLPSTLVLWAAGLMAAGLGVLLPAVPLAVGAGLLMAATGGAAGWAVRLWRGTPPLRSTTDGIYVPHPIAAERGQSTLRGIPCPRTAQTSIGEGSDVDTISLSGPPALQGGRPAFPEGLPLARPSLPDAERVVEDVRSILASEILTNGPYVARLEERMAATVGVQHCVAVSSCTAGLMLVLRAADLTGDVLLPSFTFAATAHAVAWNALRPTFVDIDRDTLTLSATRARAAMGVRTSAILATHTFGTPADVEGLADAAHRAGIRLFFDAAHALGSRRADRPVGQFGDAEVFSLTPTKPVVAGEGGIIATDDDDLAEACRLGRNYAKEPDYDSRFVGLNARMSEIHAAIALASLDGLEERIVARNRVAQLYRDALSALPGVSFPSLRPGDRSTYKDFAILVEAEEFRLDAASLGAALAAEGVEFRRYYSPPVHRMRAYRIHAGAHLPETDRAAARVLTLPLWVGMDESHVDRVADAMARIRSALAGTEVGSSHVASD